MDSDATAGFRSYENLTIRMMDEPTHRPGLLSETVGHHEFHHDLTRGAMITRICRRESGSRAHASCMPRAMSADGEQMAFVTWDEKVGPPDRGGHFDVFVQRVGER